ncbi:hypothetical protein [uncultured Parabacteroides sp.]|jgi:hypothetical protein|uniref:hypothetical protein n=1 Tax=uncultured Parabacteroides sp. TaxID=512312 RepID=UPI00258D43A4|nr:hypothetical protein [uncultured Parabacteroides sp.]
MGNRRRSFLFGGESVPDIFIKPEDLPAASAAYGLFETPKGNQYLVPGNRIIPGYFTDYKFIAPVVAYLRGSGGYAVFLVPDSGSVVAGRYRTVTTGAVITPGVLAPTATSMAILDFLGEANVVQTTRYYVGVVGRGELELEAFTRCREVQLNGQECHPASFGELHVIQTFLSTINSLLSYAGRSTYATALAVASTTISGSTASYIYRRQTLGTNTVSTGSKTTSYNWIPITPLRVKFTNPNIKPSYMDIEGSSSTTPSWTEGKDGWWTAPKITGSGAYATVRFNIDNFYANSRLRIHLEFSSLTTASFLFGKLSTAVTTSNYYLSIGARTTSLVFSYDYVLATTGSHYIDLMYRRASNVADVNDVRIKVEQIDSQVEPLPAMTITQQGDWTLNDNDWYTSPPIAVNQNSEQRILITTAKANQTVRIKAYTEGGHYSYDYISIGKLDQEWNSAGVWTAKIMQSDYTERLPYIVDISIPTKGDHFIVMHQFSGTGESVGYFTVEDAKGLDPIPAFDYYVEGDWTLNADGYYESPAIPNNGKTLATIRALNRSTTRIDATLKFYASSDVEDILYIGYDNSDYTNPSDATNSDSGTTYSASNPKTTTLRVLSLDRTFKHIWYQKNWTGAAGTDKGYFKLEIE